MTNSTSVDCFPISAPVPAYSCRARQIGSAWTAHIGTTSLFASRGTVAQSNSQQQPLRHRHRPRLHPIRIQHRPLRSTVCSRNHPQSRQTSTGPLPPQSSTSQFCSGNSKPICLSYSAAKRSKPSLRQTSTPANNDTQMNASATTLNR